MTFDEWWKRSGQVRGEAIFRACWNEALESALDLIVVGGDPVLLIENLKSK